MSKSPTLPPPERVRQVAETFSGRLDLNDLGAAGRLLAPECSGDLFGTRLAGAGAVMAWLSAVAARYEHAFDELRRERVIESVREGGATVRCSEYVMKMPGLWHRRRFTMELGVDDAGRIGRIELREPEAEREAWGRFLERCGSGTI